eukprot:6183820-Pleurochrysis_carterae.AAC.4
MKCNKRYQECRIDTRRRLSLLIFQLSPRSRSALSSCEAEIIAALEATKKAVYLRTLFEDLELAPNEPTPLSLDNKSAIDLAYSPEHHQFAAALFHSIPSHACMDAVSAFIVPHPTDGCFFDAHGMAACLYMMT